VRGQLVEFASFKHCCSELLALRLAPPEQVSPDTTVQPEKNVRREARMRQVTLARQECPQQLLIAGHVLRRDLPTDAVLDDLRA
jgi:hypothetical protein